MVGTRTESEKEKTKLRERQRRAITTKIFHGLRKHGGYNLSPRADINQLLRHLANEAGWQVDPDGTTYRPPKLMNRCPTCGATTSNTSGTTTPTTSSTVIAVQNGAGGFAGEGSTITSPFCIDPTNVEPNGTCASSPYACGSGKDMEIPLGFYMYSGFNHYSTTTAMAAHGSSLQLEAMASNHNTPVASPPHPTD